MAVNAGDVLECSVIHENSVSGVQINRYQFRLEGVGSLNEALVLDDIAEIIETIYNIVSALIAIRNVLREVRVHNMTQDVLLGSTDGGTYLGGTSASDDLPQGVASFIHFTTDVPRVILSKYLPSATVGDLIPSGSLGAPQLANLVAFGVALLATLSMTNGDYVYGYFSPKTSSFVQPQVAVASAVLAYQRRRKKGRGA